MPKALSLAIALTVLAGRAQAADLCTPNPYSKQDAERGKVAFDSHCALCHQTTLSGRVPGNAAKESPDIALLSADDVKFLDGNGGTVPPLLGPKFFDKFRQGSLVKFSAAVAGAANTFPAKDMKIPETYFLLTAYVLSANCEKR